MIISIFGLGMMGGYDHMTGRIKKYKCGEAGLSFKNAHLRAKPLPKFKRSKKTGYLING